MSKSTSQAKRAILDAQASWAAGKPGIEDGYFATPKMNMPWLTDGIRGEIAEGDGGEFSEKASKAKIAALHSSSALGVNFFGYWHGRDWPELAEVLEISQPLGNPRFERKFPTGIGPKSPNLDIVLSGAKELVAIESKFTEWLGMSGRKPLRETYLADKDGLWKRVGLPMAQRVAETYLEGPGFSMLDVPQLLKHLLGLATQNSSGNWRLKLVWFGPPSDAALEMKEEISRFRNMLGRESSRFSDVTYQDLWAALKPKLGKRHPEYVAYLSARYFPQ